MSEFRTLAKIFFWAVVASAASILVFYGRSLDFPRGNVALSVLVLLIVANVLADIYHIHILSRSEVTISTANNFAAVLLFGPPLAMAVAALGSAISDILLKKTWYKLLFNASHAVLSVFVSSLAYGLLNDGSIVPLKSLTNAVALAVAGGAYLMVNTATISIMMGLVHGHNPVAFAKSAWRGVAFQLITLIPLGTLLAIVYYQTPWGLVLLLFPILLTYYSFENYNKLRTESKQTIELLADAVDKRDRYTFQHSLRVSTYVEKVARRMGLDMEDLEMVVFAARIHDLGKIGIPSSVLLKEAALTPDERRIIEQHPNIGARIIGNLSTYESLRDLIAYHHERVDGKGYPFGLSYKQIPLGARILAVADAFEAMTSDRPYRKALPFEQAISELERGKGTQFDPEVVDHFLSVLSEDKQVWQAGIGIDLLAIKKEG